MEVEFDYKFKYELKWIFKLSKELKFFIDQSHQCNPKKIETFNKYGDLIIKTESFIKKPFKKMNNFYGCTFCGKYHFCENSLKTCPIINNIDNKVCFFSGKIVMGVDFVITYERDIEFKQDNQLFLKRNKCNNIIKRSLPDLNGNKKCFYENKENIKVLSLNNKNNYLPVFKKLKIENKQQNDILLSKLKSTIEKGPLINEEKLFEDKFFKKFNNNSEIIKEKYEEDEDNDNDYIINNNKDQINPIEIEFNFILNKYFSYLDNIINENLNILKPLCKNNCLLLYENNNYYNNNKKDLIFYENICIKNSFYQLFNDSIQKNIDYLIYNIDNNSSISIKQNYYKIINRIIGLVYNSPNMKKLIKKYIEKSKLSHIESNKYSKLNIDGFLIIAFKIADITKLCNSLILNLFLDNYFLQDSIGNNILIWSRDYWLYNKYFFNKSTNDIYNKFDNNISNLILNSLNSYFKNSFNHPNWLRKSIYD